MFPECHPSLWKRFWDPKIIQIQTRYRNRVAYQESFQRRVLTLTALSVELDQTLTAANVAAVVVGGGPPRVPPLGPGRPGCPGALPRRPAPRPPSGRSAAASGRPPSLGVLVSRSRRSYYCLEYLRRKNLHIPPVQNLRQKVDPKKERTNFFKIDFSENRVSTVCGPRVFLISEKINDAMRHAKHSNVQLRLE